MLFTLNVHIKLRVNYSVLYVLSFVFALSGRPATNFWELKDLDLPMPFCEGVTNLEVAPTYFTEIENQLGGTPEYNGLIQSYHRKDWEKLGNEIATFRRVFETSRLQEAVDFLELQAQLDQIPNSEPSQIKKFESKFREILLLYPHSTLAPVLSASLASFYLKNGSYAKALGLYQTGKQEYPFHPSACVFLLGSAESQYLLHNYEDAKKGFSQVLQKCDAARLQMGSRIRLIDIDRESGQDLKKIEKAYEKIQVKNGHLISRFHPELLFNLGELKYRQGNYPSASFYFNEFTKVEEHFSECQAPLRKRLADLSVKRKDKLPAVIGNYLTVKEKFPKSDWGHFSKAHALLMEFKDLDSAEIERRLTVVDEELLAIKDEKLRTVGNIEKGLSLLEASNEEALGYLSKLNEQNGFDLKQGEVGSFIRVNTLQVLEKLARTPSTVSQAERDEKLLAPLEHSYKEWFEGTPMAKKAQNLYRDLIVQSALENLEQKGLKKSLEKLERWQTSSLFNQQKVELSTKMKLGDSLVRWWFSETNRDEKKSAERLLDKKEVISALISPEYDPLWLQTYLTVEKPLELEVALKAMEKQRSIASAFKPKDGLISSYLALMMGRAFREAKQYQKSEESLSKITHPKLSALKRLEQVKTFSSAGQFEKALKIGLRGLEKADLASSGAYLDLMKRSVLAGKKWGLSEEVLKSAQKKGLKEKDLAPFLAMSARAELEKSNCSLSIKRYEEAIKIAPDSPEKLENRFYLGKCRSKMKDTKGAIKEWREIASQKDEFWSPLAENEIKLLESP